MFYAGGGYKTYFHCAFYLVLSYILSVGVILWHYKSEDVQRWKCPERPGYVVNNSGIKVLFVSVSKTGTTSFVDACGEFGLRGYHFGDAAMGSWESLQENVSVEMWSRSMWNCRVECLAIEPLMETETSILGSPDALIVQGQRDFESWKKSAEATGPKDLIFFFVLPGRFLFGAPLAVPWFFLWDKLTGMPSARAASGVPITHGRGFDLVGHLTFQVWAKGRHFSPDVNWFFRGMFLPVHNKTDDANKSRAFFDRMYHLPKQVAPTRTIHKIDLFKGDGYGRLSEVLGLPLPPGKARDDKLPKARPRSSWTNCTTTNKFPKEAAIVWAICFACLIVNWFIYKFLFNLMCKLLCCCCADRAKPKKAAKGEKTD